MRGTPEMSVIRMTLSITSTYEAASGKIRYSLKVPEDVHIPGLSRPMAEALKELSASDVHYEAASNSICFFLDPGSDLQRHCRVVANYLRWLHDFGGGIEFKYKCPHCGHDGNFVL